MIVILQYLIAYLVRCLKKVGSVHKERENYWNNKIWCHGVSFYKTDIVFDPPCYIQRYSAVASVINEERQHGSIRKVVDFGCAEISFFLSLKAIEGVEEVLEVDVDEELIRRFSVKAEPLNFDYFYQIRKKPLNVKILCGSVDEYDDYLDDTDVVVAIELIEHLHEDTLSRLPENIFGRIRPRIAIFTTPNAEFNVLFPNFSGFRHHDHKFEWTRQQFEAWAVSIIKSYPDYTLKLYGIGPGPEGSKKFGCCSQMAVFRNDNPPQALVASPQMESTRNYKLIDEIEYPFKEDTMSLTEKVEREVRYRIITIKPFYRKINPGIQDLPLKDFLPYVDKYCSTILELSDILKAANWSIHGSGDDLYLSIPLSDTASSSSSGHDFSDDDRVETETNCDWWSQDEHDCWTDFNGWDDVTWKVEKQSYTLLSPAVSNDGRFENDIASEASETHSSDTKTQCEEDLLETQQKELKEEKKCEEEVFNKGDGPFQVIGIKNEIRISENNNCIEHCHPNFEQKLITEKANELADFETQLRDQVSNSLTFENNICVRKTIDTEDIKREYSSSLISEKASPLDSVSPDWVQGDPVEYKTVERASTRSLSPRTSSDRYECNISDNGATSWDTSAPDLEWECSPDYHDEFRPLRSCNGPRRHRKPLAKSCSLDSCLENINCERAEVQAMYLSMHSRARTFETASPSERGPDSGYPASASLDFTDGTSDDSLSGDEQPPPARFMLPPPPPVENGDVANNNRDGEGNNVEGMRNPLPAPFAVEAFPPWLLQLMLDPPYRLLHDEGLGDDL